MKKFRITVNGQSYEVEVEEVGLTIPNPVPAQVAAPAPAPAPTPKPVASPVKPSGTATEGPGAIKAPMPGKIIAVKVNRGDQVRAGDVVAILEAMKMENEILAPIDGTVQDIAVSQGANVNPGDLIIVIG